MKSSTFEQWTVQTQIIIKIKTKVPKLSCKNISLVNFNKKLNLDINVNFLSYIHITSRVADRSVARVVLSRHGRLVLNTYLCILYKYLTIVQLENLRTQML